MCFSHIKIDSVFYFTIKGAVPYWKAGDKVLNQIACKMTDTLICKANIDQKNRDIYIYGFEIAISTIFGLLSILIFSAVFCTWITGFYFLCMFVPLRIYAGGYHALTYKKCYIISMLSYMAVLIAKDMLWDKVPQFIWGLSLISAFVVIVLKAPLRNEHHPLKTEKLNKCRKRAILVVVTEFAWILNCAMRKNEDLLKMPILSICLVALAMIVQIVLNHKDNKGGRL